MKRLLLILWLFASALLLLLAIALGYVSLMMGAVHWDWWLSAGRGVGFLSIARACIWMCRRSYGLLDARKSL